MPPPAGVLDQGDLGAELVLLEVRRYTDTVGIRERAERVEAVAAERGLGHERARAHLVLADVAGRGADVAGAFDAANEVLVRARADGDATLVARAEAVIAWCLFRMGALGDALMHAVEAVSVLPASAPDHFRVDHLMVLALLSGLQTDSGSYVAEFEVVLTEAERLGEPHLLLAVLNNYAWSHWRHGRAADAVPLVARLEELSRSSGIALNSTSLDTVASVLMAVGDLARAETVARAMLEPAVPQAEARAMPEAVLTLAKLRRLRGDPVEALELVLRAERIAAERGLPEITAMATEEKSGLLAEAGDYRGAYESLAISHGTSMIVRDRAADERATVLHALFKTEQARQRSAVLEELAERDALTGLWNRRRLDRLLPDLLTRHGERGTPLSLAIVDVDHFKTVNDERSHQVGDATLAELGRLLQSVLPEPGFTARLGGEEFVLVMADTDASAAHAICEVTCRLVRDQPWDRITAGIPVTVSIGVATAPPVATVSELLGRADEVLYVAKRNGRDQVRSEIVTPQPG